MLSTSMPNRPTRGVASSRNGGAAVRLKIDLEGVAPAPVSTAAGRVATGSRRRVGDQHDRSALAASRLPRPRRAPSARPGVVTPAERGLVVVGEAAGPVHRALDDHRHAVGRGDRRGTDVASRPGMASSRTLNRLLAATV